MRILPVRSTTASQRSWIACATSATLRHPSGVSASCPSTSSERWHRCSRPCPCSTTIPKNKHDIERQRASSVLNSSRYARQHLDTLNRSRPRGVGSAKQNLAGKVRFVSHWASDVGVPREATAARRLVDSAMEACEMAPMWSRNEVILRSTPQGGDEWGSTAWSWQKRKACWVWLLATSRRIDRRRRRSPRPGLPALQNKRCKRLVPSHEYLQQASAETTYPLRPRPQRTTATSPSPAPPTHHE